ncbi:phosphoglycerate dehydrogenase [Kocuria sp. ZOR0020]|uniref:phosphoglycerate dehydrogenase n=1 Tax=Kocuria sp. ZOR0020 TaxID=1339234 RepID=UPI0006454A5B|nr:phosphoglycerate dehydrogenase [Kocuria sp. ZOR0020]
MGHVLVTTDYLGPGDAVDRILTDAGHTVTYSPARGTRDDDERLRLLADVDAAIVASEPVTAEMLAGAARLKVIARSGVGFDSVDTDAAQELGIWVCNAPGVNHHSVAEMTMALMLTAAKHLDTVIPQVRQGQWPRTAGTELRGKTLGILGFGASGRAVATLAAAFGMTVLVHTAHPDLQVSAVEYVELGAIQARSDYLSLHVKPTAENRNMVDGDFLAAMNPTAVVVNTARGSLIDEAALATALESKSIGGAALDVVDREPLTTDSPLAGRDDVVIVSHLAGQTEEARMRAGESAARQVLAVLGGRQPSAPVNAPKF